MRKKTKLYLVKASLVRRRCMFVFSTLFIKKMAHRTSELLKTASLAIVPQRTRVAALSNFKEMLGLF
jgi:hypothetical protein